MLNIAEYQVIETLYQGSHSSVYRCKKPTSQQTVIIKIPAITPPSTQQISKLCKEFELRQRITSTHIVNYLELKPSIAYGYLLIEEDDHADTLISHIPSTGFAPLPFLNIAMQLVEGLGDIHRSHVIHKDIKPHNIIYQPDIGRVKYIDFNNASLLQQQASSFLISTTEATLAYISPEQTGRINRLIDYRTDFYSLGITFYQLLCGQLPFKVSKLIELVHCHLARQPLTPHEVNPIIPKALSDIVMKLLQKDADNRYQSAYGLLIDLKRCHDDLIEKGEITTFTLAEHDISEYFHIPQKLYGRETEFELLSQSFDRIQSGRAEIVMITGPAGSGKSTLAQEMQPLIAVKQGYFLMGKFELLKCNIAYHAITQAFQMWIQQILSLSKEEITNWKTQLLMALGHEGQLLIDIMPDLELILGKQPAIPSLDAEQTKHRFHWVFQQFITVLAQPTHPLVLFIDDWQWADEASLTLLSAIMTNQDTKNLLLIGAYRDNEVDILHPALTILATLKKSDIAIQTLSLSPLNVTAINQWIAEGTHQTTEVTLPLTILLYKKTEGLPFFIKIFLQTLYEQGLLILVESRWTWDLDKVQQLPATENVINFMIQQMQQLPLPAQDTIQIACCLEHRFSFSQLQLVTQKSAGQLQAELQPLLNSGLLLQINMDFQFAHDRVQEAVYQQISAEKRAVLHLTIGRLLQANLPAETTLEQSLAVIDHFNQSIFLITDKNERLKLAKINFEISNRIKTAAAYQAALNYLHFAENYLDTTSIWTDDYDFALAFYQALADMEYLNGHFSASETAINLLLMHAHTSLEKVEVYNTLLIQKTMSAKYQEAIQLGYTALQLLDINLPEKDYMENFYVEHAKIEEFLVNRTITSLYDLPELELSKQKAAIKLLYNIAAPTFLSNQELYRLITVVMVNLSLKFGNSPESAMAYSMYGIVLSSNLLNAFEKAAEFGLLAIKLSDKFKAAANRCRTRYIYINFIQHWRENIKLDEQYLNEAYQAGIEAGEFQFVGYICQYKAIAAFYKGKALTSINSELTELEKFAVKTKNQLVIDIIQVVRIIILDLTENNLNIQSISLDSVRDQNLQRNWKNNQSYYALANYYVLKAKVLYLSGYFQLAYRAICCASDYMQYIPGTITQATYNFYYSLILVNLFPTASADMQQQYRQQLEENQINLQRWSDNCPANFLHKYKLVAAEIARIDNNRLEAEDQYEAAIQAAEQQGFIHEQALANELVAEFWLAQHKPNYARGLLQTAYKLYERWGAKYKSNQLSQQHPELLQALMAADLSSFTISGEESISANNLRLLDLTSILKTSQSISSEMDLTKLLVKIMNTLIENAGAQKGAFLSETSDTWLVQAEYTQERQIQILKQVTLSEWQDGAQSIIEYVKRTQRPLLLGNASTDSQFCHDTYINTHQLQSVLCLPVVRHQQLKGILYLENNLAPYMFNEQHLQILTILASQIAISLENVKLYESIRTITTQLNIALKCANMGCWSWSMQDNKLHWDEHMLALYGIKKEDFGNNYESFIAMVYPDDRIIVERSIQRVLELGSHHDIQLRIIKQNDKSIHTLVSRGCAYRDDKGQIQGMIGACCDITPLKIVEEERLQALKQAEEKERHRAEEAEKYRKNLEDFINMVCHEIRNPMSGIYGNVDFQQQIINSLKPFSEKLISEMQSTNSELLQKLEESSQEIYQCAKHQKAIIDDVLDLSKLESGKIELINQPFRLKTIIEETAQIYAAPLAQKKLPLRLILPEVDPWVKGDAHRLKMILINFMSNAVKFTEHGEIKIRLQLLETTFSHTTFALSVEDTGIGMTASEQSQVFKRFARVASTEYEGSGLGLLLSKRFIERMGGKIQVNSEKGKGSQFTIQLTCETANAEARSTPLTARTAPPSSTSVSSITQHILIVEDNMMNQRLLRRQLEAAGYRCEVANNGQEAVDKCAVASFDLIFMDIEMPVMGGFEATQIIRQREQQSDITRRVPIIALSAYTSKDFIEKALSMGMDDYVTKPYEKDKLYQAAQKWTATQPEQHPTPITADTIPVTGKRKANQLSPLTFWSESPFTEANQAVKTWMPKGRRNALYPLLDKLSQALNLLNIVIIQPEAELQAKASKTGWQLYCMTGQEEDCAVLNLEHQTHVDELINIIQRCGIPVHAKKIQSGSVNAIAISFSNDTALCTGIETIISNLSTQWMLQPTPH